MRCDSSNQDYRVRRIVQVVEKLAMGGLERLAVGLAGSGTAAGRGKPAR
jgi:hypothetical protein